MEEEEPECQFFPVCDELTSPCYAEQKQKRQYPLFVTFCIKLDRFWIDIPFWGDDEAFFELYECICNAEDHKESQGCYVGVRHKAFESTGLSPRLAPFETLESVIFPKMKYEETEKQAC
jgi:hypothetical protein